MSKLNKWVVIPIIGVLIVGLLAIEFLYLQEADKLKTAQSEIAALEENVSTLEDDISILTGNVSTLQGDISAVEGYVSTLQGGVSTLEGDVSILKGGVSVLEDNIPTLETELVGADTNSLLEVVTMLEPSVVRIETDIAVGSGVIITNTGWILTNAHVLQGARTMEVILMNGTTYTATVIASDAGRDLAIVEVISNRTDFPEAVLGLSTNITVGEGVVAIGYPLWPELEGQATFTKGIVSAIRNIDLYTGISTKYIQTDTAINLGNSGGPLVNLTGEVIGINTWTIRLYDGEIWEGLGFAIPIDDAKLFIQDTIG
jgi:S1-C subfamily serine protease|tara:strand:- start:2573 stop:3517 length:945 start_codon:yes stop_codon:yes gene_type:complete